jgi:hypothetical protein
MATNEKRRGTTTAMRGVATLAAGRHNRGWPHVTVLIWVDMYPTTWRYCVQVTGILDPDAIYKRNKYLEVIKFTSGVT